MGTHSETIEITYDSELISTRTLLEEFWGQHSGKNHGYGGRQYMSILLYTTEEQRQEAERMLHEFHASNRHVDTELAPLERFTEAEAYHQKYILRRFPRAVNALSAAYGASWYRSTAAAKLNACAAGEMSSEEMQQQLAGDASGAELAASIKW